MKINNSFVARWLFVASFGLLFTACKQETDDVTPQSGTTPTSTSTVSANQTVNEWILENMRDLYYWNTKIPANPDLTLTPDKFFDSLLNKFNATTNPNGDRFSWINESADELQASLSGQSVTTGMEYDFYLRSAGSDNIIVQVLYVLPGSPAERSGLKRGDIISKVNGQLLTRSNYIDLLFGGSTTFTFGLATPTTTTTGTTLTDTDQTRTVTATVFQENPVFLDSIYTVGGRKVGYVVYNQFVPGANNSTAKEYDAQLDAIFNSFKAQGVNELVLDLRYNPGGYTSSSANLASLIGKGVNASKLFFREEWNATVTPIIRRQEGDDFFVQNFLDKPQNIGNNLTRLYVLTTDHTASASELIINGLRPYMPVITIGTTTTGKNVGSITIEDETGKIKWGMQPIVFRSFNSQNQSDYWTGFAPNVTVSEPLNLLPLGDTREALLSAALAQISGSTSSGRTSSVTANPLTSVGSSIERKAGGGRMIKALKTLPTIQ
ncbi:S41 family peptidase [Spirosoma montaniterrae]|uniref:Peptidase S41 n=1 Tax=Spirosoma montaniterrae TaxID=1178516 RepID=A0A1P9X445_9BACT|nr:peptidase S41 [Spirosoma montaniterrae]